MNPKKPSKQHSFLSEKKRVLNLLRYFCTNPVGGDKQIAQSCKAYLMYCKEDATLVDEVVNAKIYRANNGNYLTLVHAINIATIHAPNYIFYFLEKSKKYPFQTAEEWIEAYRLIKTKYLKTYSGILHHNEIHTTSPKRGVGFALPINRLLKGKEVNVLDFGCSANMIWSHIVNSKNGNESKFSAVDHTRFKNKNRIFARQAQEVGINVKQEYGIDHVNSLASEASIRWFLSCRHFKNVSREEIQKTKQMIKKYQKNPKCKFIMGSVEKRASFPLGWKPDVVTISLVLYQQSQRLTQAILRQAKKYGPELIIINDYCNIDEKNKENLILFENRNFRDFKTVVWSKKLGNNWFEIAQYNNSLCEEIFPGKDFQKFMELSE